jgi:hypothetical protein
MKKLGILATGFMISVSGFAINDDRIPNLSPSEILLPEGYRLRSVISETSLDKLDETGTEGQCSLKIRLPMLQFATPGIPTEDQQKVIDRITNVHKHLYNFGLSSLGSFLSAVQDDYHCTGTWNTSWVEDLDYNITAVFQNNLASVVYTYYTYTGGAHGFSGYASEIFDFELGGIVPPGLDKFLNQSHLSDILGLLEAKLTQDELFEIDFGWNEWKKEINHMVQIENFFLTDSGISFYWNPYEIGPYAVGHFVVPLTWDELKPYRAVTRYSKVTPLGQ